MGSEFREKLKEKMDEYIKLIYQKTKDFPRDEIYGITSQLRRAALSVVLNYIEGYARRRPTVCYSFWEIAYGSLQESKYLTNFSYQQRYLDENSYKSILGLEKEIGAMLWKAIESLKTNFK